LSASVPEDLGSAAAPPAPAVALPAPPHRDLRSLIPIAAGLWWLLAGHGLYWYFWALTPGLVLTGAGVSLLLWPGDAKQLQFLALGAAVGAVFAIPAGIGGQVLSALGALAVSLAAFVCSGFGTLRAFPRVAGAPEPLIEPVVAVKVGLDQALLGTFNTLARVVGGPSAERMGAEAIAMEAVMRERGWLGDPGLYHRVPPAPEIIRSSAAVSNGFQYLDLRFDSGFTPDPAMPGAERWMAHERNRECAAWLHRHETPGRPWLVCIHGYRVGVPWFDFQLFTTGDLHVKRGLNLLMPVLPLHGPRRRGAFSGDLYFDGDMLDLVHAESQALWDLRRCIAWIRAQEPAARIGVLGFSLGGYNAALLAAHEPGLDMVIAGIPVVDLASLLWEHVPTPRQQYYSALGLTLERYRTVMRLVSPLSALPKLPPERLHIFAGTADSVIPPAQPLQLAEHWGASINWFPAGHLTYRGESAVKNTIDNAIASANWV
jgi:hypothetical protein